jgi:acetylornithine deacetylase/succinyl-diaminopimelate desuccinylase-like protein
MAAQDPAFSARVSLAQGQARCYTGEIIEGERFFPAWICREDEGFVRVIRDQLLAVGQQPSISHYAFCTNGSHYAGEKGIKTLGLGPSFEHLAHTVDEYIDIAQMEAAVEAYMAVAGALLS